MTITGGTLMAVSTNEMVETPTSTDGQGWVSAEVTGAAGDAVTVADSSGTVLGSFTPPKAFRNVIFSAPGMANGSTYTVTAGSSSVEATAGQGGVGPVRPGGPGGPVDPGGPGAPGAPSGEPPTENPLEPPSEGAVLPTQPPSLS